MNIFTKKFIMSIVDGHQLDDVALSNKSIKEYYEEKYSWMIKYRRTEYVYKNAIAEKIYLGRHSERTAAYYTEVRARLSILDCLIVNGTTTAYEIKSEYDDLTRLPEQLNDYVKVFEYVYAVVPPQMAEKVLRALPRNIGLIVLTPEYTLSVKKEAISNIELLEHGRMFELLRKSEMTNELNEYVRHVPIMPNTKVRAFYKDVFMRLSKGEAHKVVVNALRKRRIRSLQDVSVKKFPRSLYSIVSQLELSRLKWNKLRLLFE